MSIETTTTTQAATTVTERKERTAKASDFKRGYFASDAKRDARRQQIIEEYGSDDLLWA